MRIIHISLLMSVSVFSTGCGEDVVNAYYYPNKNNLTYHQLFANVGSVENCRLVVRDAAAKRGDPDLVRGDYECCVNPTGEKLGEITICNETVR